MRFSIHINQCKALEWGLNIQQAALFSFFYELGSWADAITVEGETYYRASKGKIVTEFPLLTSKPDTVYRLVSQLMDKELIRRVIISNRTYFCLTERGRQWNEYGVGDISEGRKRIRAGSEKSPPRVGNESAQGSEPIPTDKYTNNQTYQYPFTNDHAALARSHAPAVHTAAGQAQLAPDTRSGFEQFWAAYPKKRSRGQALKIFIRLNPDEALLARMINAIARAKASPEWTQEQGKYIPYPATWLNACGWEDDYASPHDRRDWLEQLADQHYEDTHATY